MPELRKMLSNWNAPYIQALVKQIETQSKPTLANWAINYSEKHILPLWTKNFPNDERPQNAITAAREWLAGNIKLPPVKALILECHKLPVSRKRSLLRRQPQGL